MVLTIVAAVFVFGLLVLVHELGHFITAKMTGMRVDEFAIGFGAVRRCIPCVPSRWVVLTISRA